MLCEFCVPSVKHLWYCVIFCYTMYILIMCLRNNTKPDRGIISLYVYVTVLSHYSKVPQLQSLSLQRNYNLVYLCMYMLLSTNTYSLSTQFWLDISAFTYSFTRIAPYPSGFIQPPVCLYITSSCCWIHPGVTITKCSMLQSVNPAISMHAAMLPSEMTLEDIITMQAIAVTGTEGEVLPLLEPVNTHFWISFPSFIYRTVSLGSLFTYQNFMQFSYNRGGGGGGGIVKG